MSILAKMSNFKHLIVGKMVSESVILTQPCFSVIIYLYVRLLKYLTYVQF